MSVVSNKSCSHNMCVEETLAFSAVAQRFIIGGKNIEGAGSDIGAKDRAVVCDGISAGISIRRIYSTCAKVSGRQCDFIFA